MEKNINKSIPPNDVQKIDYYTTKKKKTLIFF